MKRKRGKGRRPIEIFSMSFLDVVSCGFGAIILVLVIMRISEPLAIEALRIDLSGLLAKLEEERYALRGETKVLNRDLNSKQQQVSEIKTQLARLQGDLSKLKGQYQASRLDNDTQSTLTGQLLSAQQSLSAEMQRLAQQQPVAKKNNNVVAGIPADSEYIIFIIDTSGSMQHGAWPLVIKKLDQVLDSYPHVKGIQVMNDMGGYLFSQFSGKWIPDTPARRRAILRRMRRWAPFSNSSPVEGITRAINTFSSPKHKISLYVFGDEFSSGTIDGVVNQVDKINKTNRKGERRVRIHGIGFPTLFRGNNIGPTSVRFAALMRVLAYRNGGTFVALNGNTK